MLGPPGAVLGEINVSSVFPIPDGEFHMLTAYLQSFELADRVTVRHAATFVVGLFGIAALLPIGRLAMGRWAGLAAIALCLMTGYLYGSLFFTPIDVPFLAVMTWATLAITVMTRQVLPSWRATAVVGLLTGLAIATRTGGIITHAYLLGAMILCVGEFWVRNARVTPRYIMQITMRYAAVVVIAWVVAIALWPWLQTGNPWAQFKVALVHFATIPMSYEFPSWGQRLWTDALPWSYIPDQLLARLPGAFLFLLALAFFSAMVGAADLVRQIATAWRDDRIAGLRTAVMTVARARAGLVVARPSFFRWPSSSFSVRPSITGYGTYCSSFPCLRCMAGAGLRALLPLLRRAPIVAAVAGGAYAGGIVATLAALHPLEYVAMNALVGGTRGAYERFELDYWSVAATEALRRLERRVGYDTSVRSDETPPSILICIPWREPNVSAMLQRPWIVETDPDKADFIIATELWRCGRDQPVELIDEVKRFDRTFAWIYARRSIPAAR